MGRLGQIDRGDRPVRGGSGVGQPLELYLARLETATFSDEITALAQDLTVSETYFFRYGEQLRAFAELVLPDRMAAQCGARRLHILSAGCDMLGGVEYCVRRACAAGRDDMRKAAYAECHRKLA